MFPACATAGALTLCEITAMPKRTDLKSILIIGGSIVNGQACRIDYRHPACKA